MRTFSLKDDTTLSGIRIHPDDRQVVDGGYLDPMGGPLIPAHGFVRARVEGMKEGEVVVPCEANLTDGEQAATREMLWRVSRTTERS